MNRDKVKEILDKTNIYVLDEADIIEYIDELEKVKEEYIESLDKLDLLENRNNKAIEYIKKENTDISMIDKMNILDILRGENNEL